MVKRLPKIRKESISNPQIKMQKKQTWITIILLVNKMIHKNVKGQSFSNQDMGNFSVEEMKSIQKIQLIGVYHEG